MPKLNYFCRVHAALERLTYKFLHAHEHRLVGCYPFRTQDEKVLTKIYQCNYTIPNTVSVAAADLIKQLLKRIPHQRTPIKYIQKHPWLLEGGMCVCIC